MAIESAHQRSYQSDDRFTFSIFIAVLVHMLLILGISFEHSIITHTSETLEVTLARTKADQPVTEADFLAQADQLGSGDLDKAKLLTTTEIAEFHETTIREVMPVEQAPSSPAASEATTEVLFSRNSQQAQPKQPSEDKKPHPDIHVGPKKTLLERSLEIASLEAKLDSQRQAYAKRPRIYRLTAVSTMKAEDASYVHNWLRRIEHIGNLNYPQEAKRRRIYGHLRLMVAIKPDGSLHTIDVLKSSGHSLLDEAAKRIVRLASPFAPFPNAMQQKVDILEIIRTWEFKRNHSLTSY